MSSIEFSTYEATKAYERNAVQADKIHWQRDVSYRNQAYRHLHHQQGLIGTFSIRLLEAADLKRSYWSALALGPVKMLGLSKAHGAVSSFVSFALDTRETSTTTSTAPKNPDSKPAALTPPPKPCFVSPVISENDNPVWNSCHFDMPLRKGTLKDAQPIRLQLRVDEDSTAVENLIPGVPSGGDSRLLGVGYLDLTSLCLGQIVATGKAQVGVLDTWVPIYLSGKDLQEMEPLQSPDPLKKVPKTNDENNNGCMGRVRVLVSYEPHGMEPQHNDIVALEAFARQDSRTTSCTPILPSLLPLHVMDVSGSWILVEYKLQPNQQFSKKGKLRLHRNAVFVVERKNLVDETLNLALLPTDVFLSTSLGRTTQDVLGPLFVASKQLLMPALLSTKLVWMAVRTTTLASFTGVHAATSAMWSEGSSSLTQENDNEHVRRSGEGRYITL